MEENNNKKIICRKCSGPHLTIKCDKNTKDKIEQNISKDTLKVKPEDIKFTSFVKKNFKNQYKMPFKSTYRVKITDLPVDMSEEEMMELTYNWGHIIKVKVLNYNESTTAYIDFEYKEEAEYFVKAIDKTPFEYLLISAQLIN